MSEERYAYFDISRSPLISIKFMPNPTDEQFELYLLEVEQLYKIGSPDNKLVIIFDTTEATLINSKLRARQIEWSDKNVDLIRRNCAGTVFVLPNIILEVVFKMIVVFSPIPVPTVTCRSLIRAEIEAKKMLEKVQHL